MGRKICCNPFKGSASSHRKQILKDLTTVPSYIIGLYDIKAEDYICRNCLKRIRDEKEAQSVKEASEATNNPGAIGQSSHNSSDASYSSEEQPTTQNFDSSKTPTKQALNESLSFLDQTPVKMSKLNFYYRYQYSYSLLQLTGMVAICISYPYNIICGG